MAEALARWTRGNNAGEGYAPYTDVPGDDTIEAAVEAALDDGAELVLARTNSDEIAVLRMDDGGLMGIGGDGMGNGAWAVDLGGES
jgi:hypothetical protein